MVLGKSKYDKQFDKEIKNLYKWIQVHTSDINNCWAWIQKQEQDNKAQTQFDNSVTTSIRELDAKLNNALELAKHIKELQQQVAALLQASHSHKEES